LALRKSHPPAVPHERNGHLLVLVGWWPAMAREAKTTITHHNVHIHRCPEADCISSVVYADDADWLLVGPDLDDRETHRAYSAAKAVREDLKLAILGPSRDWRRCERWLRRGCRVYLDDTAEPDRVAGAVDAAESLHINVTDRSFVQILQERSAGPAPHLTHRECEVLDLLRRGMRNKDIAQALHVTDNTVEYHMRHLLSKFEARSRLEVIERATALGLA
jgi:DNA-binding NarL/FixJ family response regulator